MTRTRGTGRSSSPSRSRKFARYGAWYLVALGAVAIGVVLTMPGGLWGTTAVPRGWSLLPVGYLIRRNSRSGTSV